MTSSSENPEPEHNHLEITSSRQFPTWLAQQGISLAFTTYQTNRLFLVGSREVGRLKVHERLFDKPMGLYAQDDRLYMSTRYQLWRLDNLLAPGKLHHGADRLYIPRTAYTTGDLNVHDVVLDESGRLLFVNTDFSCLATLSKDYSFVPRWQPPFISKLVAEDRCHLNGLALVEGKPTYVTACSATDKAAGWREHRVNGGVVMHVPSQEVIATGLSMPHSPRWYRGKLWLLNSGTGELGYLDGHQFVPIAVCPGFVRGLAFWDRFALVGLSKLRSRTFSGLALEKRLAAEGNSSQCGLRVIDLETGEIVHWLRLEGVVEELFDVVVLPGVRQPQALGFQSEDIERLVTFPGSRGLVVTKPTVERPSQGSIVPVAGLPRQVWELEGNTAQGRGDGGSGRRGDSDEREQDASVPPPDSPLKFQRVYHLNAGSLAPYDAFTFPSLQQRWQTQPQQGELVGVSAAAAGAMVALAIAELSDHAAELLSLFVAPEWRQQGIGTRLVRYLEQALQSEGCHQVAVSYQPTSLSEIALEPLLQKLGWQLPVSVGEHRRSLKVFPAPPPPTQISEAARSQFEQGKALAAQGNLPEAVACFSEAIRLQPDYLAAYNQLGNALQGLGQMEQATATYQRLLEINPNVAQAHCNLGSIWQLQGQTEAAIAAYQRAIQLKPDLAVAQLNLARLLAPGPA